MSEPPLGFLCIIPTCAGVGEPFDLRIKVLGPVHPVVAAGDWNVWKPGFHGPFNRNTSRQIQFMDNALPEWTGKLLVDGGPALDGPRELTFDGLAQGHYRNDRRPIKTFAGFRWTRPGFHFLRVVDPVTGLEGLANPAFASEGLPSERIFWGDPHWQTFFSDGIRCPEELYAFARNEGFLDFGAITDHMEGVTDRQWDYFQAVTNDCNEPGRFATLIGQEWTNHDPRFGAPGHRNVYYRGSGGPVLRSTEPGCNSLQKLWSRLDAMRGVEALAIPHHPANRIMGVAWELGWNPRYEKAVEIHSVWGNSERSAADGNPLPIRHCQGEMPGRHVLDALRRGYRFGFVGGGDIHDGRPGDDLHSASYPPRTDPFHPEGFTAVRVPYLTREAVFDAMASRRTYASTKCRPYLAVTPDRAGRRVAVMAASEDGVREVVLVRNGNDVERAGPGRDARVAEVALRLEPMAPDEFGYVRLTTQRANLAWSSPFWGDGR